MAIDYNKLMEELDSCLGLESSATESVKRPPGPSKKRKAFEGYDDVDMEIIQAMKDSPEGAPSEFSEEDLVYSEDSPEGDQGMLEVEDGEGDGEESPEVKLADSVDCLFNNYVESGKTPQEAADSIKDLVESAVAELYDPDDEEAEADEGMGDVVTPVKRVSCHSIANRSSTESLFGYDDPRFQTLEDIVVRKIRKAPIDKEYKDELIEDTRMNGIEEYMGYLDENADKVEEDLKDKASMNRAADAFVKSLVDDYNGSNGSATESLISKSRLQEIYEDFWDGSGLGSNPTLEETTEYAQGYLEVFSPKELKESFGPYADSEQLAKKMLAMHKANKSAEENSKTVNDDPYDPDAAFEALSSKMLNRYSQLTHRNQLKNKKSAEEGVSTTEVKIDDNAIRRVSCEFAYSGKNLRKMVAEAIKKGVI